MLGRVDVSRCLPTLEFLNTVEESFLHLPDNPTLFYTYIVVYSDDQQTVSVTNKALGLTEIHFFIHKS